MTMLKIIVSLAEVAYFIKNICIKNACIRIANIQGACNDFIEIAKIGYVCTRDIFSSSSCIKSGTCSRDI